MKLTYLYEIKTGVRQDYISSLFNYAKESVINHRLPELKKHIIQSRG